ncbi:MAG: thiamine diphosphokinase [Bacteroidales bacterium]|nr:thiamine diphosphokinase [Bacteroidales bacterium]MDD2425346.1 thiamine diphosphokinase [Bacteroidales bacterium]MDD3989226.1 thiamine diphosphokinase [Bacteroidales bacterium]MDD4638924.1 thiamine diphosphokinase [Bacteroidales bacterium]
MKGNGRKLVIVADGEFPSHPVPLRIIRDADIVVCCDGAIRHLEGIGRHADAIVGDMDSLDSERMEKYSPIIHKDPDQESNDLTKSFNYSLALNPGSIAIAGATGRREDHTLGNISLLAEYAKKSDIPITMYTDWGYFTPYTKDCSLRIPPGTQISLFGIGESVKIESRGLKYPLKEVVFDNWWKGTLNEALTGQVELDINGGIVIVFVLYT